MHDRTRMQCYIYIYGGGESTATNTASSFVNNSGKKLFKFHVIGLHCRCRGRLAMPGVPWKDAVKRGYYAANNGELGW